jgi:hypothetical protein
VSGSHSPTGVVPLHAEPQEGPAHSWQAAFTPAPPKEALGAALTLSIHPKLRVTAADQEQGGGGGGGGVRPSVGARGGVLSGRSLLHAHQRGPPGLRLKIYKNLGGAPTGKKASQGASFLGWGAGADGESPPDKDQDAQASSNSNSGGGGGGALRRVVGLRPLEQAVAALRKEFGHLALFFVDDLNASASAPSASAKGSASSSTGGSTGKTYAGSQTVFVVWRPGWFQPKPFKPIDSRHRIRIDPFVGAPLGEESNPLAPRKAATAVVAAAAAAAATGAASL